MSDEIWLRDILDAAILAEDFAARLIAALEPIVGQED
jgi:hypothetical protein